MYGLLSQRFFNKELYLVSRWAIVTKEGPESKFFARESEERNKNKDNKEVENDEEYVQVTGDI